jgi:hypothetical protein
MYLKTQGRGELLAADFRSESKTGFSGTPASGRILLKQLKIERARKSREVDS